MLAIARGSIFSYAQGDRPKLEWLARSVADTGPLVLDVGVRTGTLARFFRDQGKTVHGIDVAKRYVDFCQATGSIEHGAVCDVATDSLPTPRSFDPNLPDGYDVVFLGEILEHLLSGKDLLSKAAQACRKGGVLILTTPNLAYLGNRLRLLLGRDLHPLTIDRGEVGHQHIRVYTRRLLEKLLAQAGCRVVDVGSDGIPISLARFVRVERLGNGRESGEALAPAQWALPGTRSLWPAFGRALFMKAVRV